MTNGFSKFTPIESGWGPAATHTVCRSAIFGEINIASWFYGGLLNPRSAIFEIYVQIFEYYYNFQSKLLCAQTSASESPWKLFWDKQPKNKYIWGSLTWKRFRTIDLEDRISSKYSKTHAKKINRPISSQRSNVYGQCVFVLVFLSFITVWECNLQCSKQQMWIPAELELALCAILAAPRWKGIESMIKMI